MSALAGINVGTQVVVIRHNRLRWAVVTETKRTRVRYSYRNADGSLREAGPHPVVDGLGQFAEWRNRGNAVLPLFLVGDKARRALQRAAAAGLDRWLVERLLSELLGERDTADRADLPERDRRRLAAVLAPEVAS